MSDKFLEFMKKEYGIKNINDLNNRIDEYNGLDISIFVSTERNSDEESIKKSS